MNLKSQNIAEAQKRKNDNIQISALQRDATILTAARMQVSEATPNNPGEYLGEEWSREKVEQEWEHWHNFLKNKLDSEILGF